MATSAKCATTLSGGTCTVTSKTGTLKWTVTVPATKTISGSFQATVNNTDKATIANTGHYTGPGCTTTPSCSTNPVTNPVPFLSTTKSVAPTGPVTPGSTLTYTLAVANTGTATGTEVVTDTAPAGTTWVAHIGQVRHDTVGRHLHRDIEDRHFEVDRHRPGHQDHLGLVPGHGQRHRHGDHHQLG